MSHYPQIRLDRRPDRSSIYNRGVSYNAEWGRFVTYDRRYSPAQVSIRQSDVSAAPSMDINLVLTPQCSQVSGRSHTCHLEEAYQSSSGARDRALLERLHHMADVRRPDGSPSTAIPSIDAQRRVQRQCASPPCGPACRKLEPSTFHVDPLNGHSQC